MLLLLITGWMFYQKLRHVITQTLSLMQVFGKRASYHQFCLFLKFPRYESSKSLIRKNIEKHLSTLY